MLTESSIPDHEIDRNPLPLWLRWNRTSPQLVIESESKLLQRLKSGLKGFFVPIFGGNCYIRTMVAMITGASDTATTEKLPIVLIHGFASGLGLWCKNIDAFAAYRHVYAFDLLGFGRSSRPVFPKTPTEVETHWVDSVEEWRSAVNLDKFILLGHSLGGYISTAYALRYPQRVAHLILVDPWGFNEVPFDENTMARISGGGILLRTIRNYFSASNPLAFLRALGPFGRGAIHRVREDLRGTFDQRYLLSGECLEVPSNEDEAKHAYHSRPLADSEPSSSEPSHSDSANGHSGPLSAKKALNSTDLDGSIALDYIYHVNVQTPSGEMAFKSLCTRVPWACNPMLERIDQLDTSLPITFIFGSRSWMDISSGTKTKAKRPNSYVGIKIIEGAGHQVYAEASDEFNACVNDVAARVDAGELFNLGASSAHSPHSFFPSPGQTPPSDRTRKKRRSIISSPSKTQLSAAQPHGSPSQNRRNSSDDLNDETSD